MSGFTITGGKPTIDKDPDAVLDYVIDFGPWLTREQDTITDHLVKVTGVTLDSSYAAGTKIVLWLSGGEVGQKASATAQITTAGGRVEERTIYFKIRER